MRWPFSTISQQYTAIHLSLANLAAQGAKIMQGLTDLQNALKTLTDAVTANTTAVSAAATNFAALAADLSTANSAGGDPDQSIENIATALNTEAATLQNATAALQAAATAAMPSPAPSPTPTPTSPSGPLGPS